MLKLIYFLDKLELFFPHQQRLISNHCSNLMSIKILGFWERSFLHRFYDLIAIIPDFFRGGQNQALFSSMAKNLFFLAQKRCPTNYIITAQNHEAGII